MINVLLMVHEHVKGLAIVNWFEFGTKAEYDACERGCEYEEVFVTMPP